MIAESSMLIRQGRTVSSAPTHLIYFNCEHGFQTTSTEMHGLIVYTNDRFSLGILRTWAGVT
jgi:hypothetical protein